MTPDQEERLEQMRDKITDRLEDLAEEGTSLQSDIFLFGRDEDTSAKLSTCERNWNIAVHQLLRVESLLQM